MPLCELVLAEKICKRTTEFSIRYWEIESRRPLGLVPTYHLLFPFIVYSWCIVVFIGNVRTRNDEYANSIRYISQQRGRTRFSSLKICISIGFREIGVHSPLGIEPEVTLIVVILVPYY